MGRIPRSGDYGPDIARVVEQFLASLSSKLDDYPVYLEDDRDTQERYKTMGSWRLCEPTRETALFLELTWDQALRLSIWHGYPMEWGDECRDLESLQSDYTAWLLTGHLAHRKEKL